MKKKQSSYNSDPGLVNIPLRVDEVESLALSAGDLQSEEVRHLLTRALISLKEQRRRINELQNDVEKIATQNALVGHPMQISIDFLNRLTPDEMIGVLDARYLKSLNELDKEKENYEQQKLLLYSEINRVKFILSTILENPNYPVELKENLKNIIDSYTNS